MNCVLHCHSCNKELASNMEIEYSQWLNEYYCNPECASNRYFEYMQSQPLDLSDRNFFKENSIKVVEGKLYKKE